MVYPGWRTSLSRYEVKIADNLTKHIPAGCGMKSDGALCLLQRIRLATILQLADSDMNSNQVTSQYLSQAVPHVSTEGALCLLIDEAYTGLYVHPQLNCLYAYFPPLNDCY